MHDIQKRVQQKYEDPFKDELHCRQEIPLRWNKMTHSLSDDQWMLIQNDNFRLMEVLIGGEDTLDPEQMRDREVFKEIRKLDAKLNLLMSWLGRIMWQQQETPSMQPISLSANGLRFYNDFQKNNGDVKNVELAENDELFMELFLEPRYPQPFTTLAKVVHINLQNARQELSVQFVHMNEQNRQLLDKYVFRLHRRQVALTRKKNHAS